MTKQVDEGVLEAASGPQSSLMEQVDQGALPPMTKQVDEGKLLQVHKQPLLYLISLSQAKGG